MFCAICDNLTQLHYKGQFYRKHGNGGDGGGEGGGNGGTFSFMDFFTYAQNLIFTADLCFAGIGYMSPAPFLGVEPTVLGWVSALICYDPFCRHMHSHFFPYSQNGDWNVWFDSLAGNTNASARLPFRLWGCTILALQAVFTWCTVSFGLRYSNLSYRTIVSTGPYYFTRHPAYVSKILSFAMIHVPWVDVRALHRYVARGAAAAVSAKECATGAIAGAGAGAGADAGAGGIGQGGAYFNALSLRYCVSLALFAGVYVLRAWTEEAHLTAASSGLYQQYVGAVAGRWQWLLGR